MPHEIVDKFSTHLKNVLTRALCFVVETDEKMIEPSHLLWALGTQKGCIGGEILKKVGIKQNELRILVGATAYTKLNPSAAANATLRLSSDAKRIVEKAVLTANIYGHRYVGTEHLLSGILQINNPLIDQFFAAQKTDLKEMRQQLSIVLKSTSKFPDLAAAMGKDKIDTAVATQTQEDEAGKMPALDFFARELTSLDLQKMIDPVIGRESEIERLMQILCRRTKNNPLLTGAPGVGKTAIVEGLAKRIVEGNVPSVLQNKRIFALDMALLIAGTMYRGEFEGRLRQVVDEVKKNEDAVLFIDEIHTIVGAGAASGSMDAANILKPALARGEIRCIGATTPDEYKKQIESDSALERRFQTILIEEPSLQDAQLILQGLAPSYESFHRVRITPDAIEHAVKLSARYLQDRQLPDKAIDLMDEAAAAARIAHGQSDALRKRHLLEQELQHVREIKRQAVVEERFLDAINLKREEERVRTSMEIATDEKKQEPIPLITQNDIAQVISRMTGIPVSDLIEGRRATAENFQTQLSVHVLGQPSVLPMVARALSRAKSGVIHPKRPLASFLFLGPSGVGKTELAKAIAKTFFKSEKNFIRLDMSEYAEGFTVSKLIGSPAGYVGYKDQSNLTDRVKQRPYSVVLFDEMEKAHPDVQNLLLQILEEGDLTDATGRTINFKNTILILTTNIGLEKFEHGGIGFSGSLDEERHGFTQDMRKELEERFRPELVNRLDTICVFDPLKKETLAQIVEKELHELCARMQEFQTLELTFHQNLPAHLAESLDAKLGARSVRQKIQQEVETKIAERLAKQDHPRQLHLNLTRSGISITTPRKS
jgi:ATP-dependent Clp protease ATP-binding subunit ClpC